MLDLMLVTGATGTVGRQLVPRLVQAQALVRVTSHVSRPPQHGVQAVGVDFLDADTLRPALEDVERLFLLTPIVPDMVEIATTVVQLAREEGVKRIVYLSTLMPRQVDSLLIQWHQTVEQAVKSSGIGWTIIRPNSYMQNFITSYGVGIPTDDAFYLPLGDGRVSLIDARDVAAVAASAMLEPGHLGTTYDLTGETALSCREVAETLSEVLGRSIEYVDISESEAATALREAGYSHQIITAFLQLWRGQKEGLFSAVSPAVQQVTGIYPRSFADFAHDYAEAFRTVAAM
jgi:uncharacterized protein YbjT (DUF2867 family)